nr:MAG TPA: hypothetical protein [Crassvirales sp.]
MAQAHVYVCTVIRGAVVETSITLQCFMTLCARSVMRDGLNLLQGMQKIYPLKIGTSTTIRSGCVCDYSYIVVYYVFQRR